MTTLDDVTASHAQALLDSINGNPGNDDMAVYCAKRWGLYDLAEQLMAKHDELAGEDQRSSYAPAPRDAAAESGDLKPLTWDGFIGQSAAIRELTVRARSAAQRSSPIPPTLLVGPGGTGKTTLARLIADELDRPLITLSKPPANTDRLIDELWPYRNGVVFFDEVHLFHKRQQHDLMDLTEPPHRLQGGWEVTFPNLSVIAATTEPANLAGPLLSRFECRPAWEPYTASEMVKIVRSMADRAGLNEELVTAELAVTLADASAGNPRQARALVIAARDLILVDGEATGQDVLAMCRVQPDGLSIDHIRYLELLAAQPQGTAGKEALSTILQMAPGQVRVVERLLVERRLVVLTGTGRQITPKGRDRLNGGYAA